MPTPPSTPPPLTSMSSPSSNTTKTTTMTTTTTTTASTFDINSYYTHLLTTNPNLTPPIAAIESLISLLSSPSLSHITTISETLNLISTASATLISSQRNPIPVRAGTDLFQRYLITSFQNNPIPTGSSTDFTHLRNSLVGNSKVFVARAKNARTKIARFGLPLIRDGSVVITYGGSRVVNSLLSYAADSGRWFRVVQVLPPSLEGVTATISSTPASSSSSSSSLDRISAQVSNLRKSNIEVATVPLSALSYVLNSLPVVGQTGAKSMVILGTSAILENGAATAEMGSLLVAQIARMHGVPLYVATESYKFATQFPLGYGAKDLEVMGTKQEVLKFVGSTSTSTPAATVSGGGGSSAKEEGLAPSPQQPQQQLIDITPPTLITGLITENGMMTPNAVAEELIKLWF